MCAIRSSARCRDVSSGNFRRERAELGAFRDGRFLDVNDQPIDWLSPSSTVRLWHPLGYPPKLYWNGAIGSTETLSCSPSNRRTAKFRSLPKPSASPGCNSNRFAAHVLRQHQFAALCRERGWQYRLQETGDSRRIRRYAGFRAGASRSNSGWRLRADRLGLANSGVFQFICTDQVRFRSGRRASPIGGRPGSRVLRSDARCRSLRGRMQIGNDLAWADRGPEPYGDYWRTYSFGELSELARTRRPVLEALIPKLGIADWLLNLEERFLVVRGDSKTYKIHLGSVMFCWNLAASICASFLHRTRSKCACAMCGFRSKATGVCRSAWSKALMLAGDTKITHTLIVQQIRRF